MQTRDDSTSRSTASTESCQYFADIKAFTGRGRARRGVRFDVVALAAELDQIHREMGALAHVSRKVPGHGFYLAVHRRNDVDGKCKKHTIRWRDVASARHLPWEAMSELIARQLPVLAQWYRDVTDRAIRLNAEESATRGALRAAERYLALASDFRDG